MLWLIKRVFMISKEFLILFIKFFQLKNLYGPLYGNRLVRITAFKAAIGDSIDVEEYLKKAEENKDAEMIKNWRNYVIKVLLPLDQKVRHFNICYSISLTFKYAVFSFNSKSYFFLKLTFLQIHL